MILVQSNRVLTSLFLKLNPNYYYLLTLIFSCVFI